MLWRRGMKVARTEYVCVNENEIGGKGEHARTRDSELLPMCQHREWYSALR